MVTARTESVDKIRGLGLGADDYIGGSATVMVHVNRIREKIEDDPKNLVNSFGATIMAAFAAAVKIDTFAYLPVQDFGNAFSTFVAQNYGAGNKERIRKGTRVAFGMSIGFSVVLICDRCRRGSGYRMEGGLGAFF